MYICMCCVNQLVIETKHFHIHVDILVLVSEFVVVVILSEWWLLFLSGGRYRPLLTTVGTSLHSEWLGVKFILLVHFLT